MIGLLAYYPQVHATIGIVELEFAKPRRPLSEILDEMHQSAPMLVLAGDAQHVEGVHVREVNGRKYVEKTIEIMRYLAATRGVPLPH